MEKTEKSIQEMSSSELEQLLKLKQKDERELEKKARKQYEGRRNELVGLLVGKAKDLHGRMITSKSLMIELILEFKKQAEEYADIRTNSKGGFSLRSSDGKQRVVYERNVKFEYDERAKEAEALIKDFLADTVKKRDMKTYTVITNLLEKNKKGDYTPALISGLQKSKDEFDDVRWIKALKLFSESYNEVEVSYSLSFYEKNEQSKDEHISLTFSSLPINTEN